LDAGDPFLHSLHLVSFVLQNILIQLVLNWMVADGTTLLHGLHIVMLCTSEHIFTLLQDDGSFLS